MRHVMIIHSVDGPTAIYTSKPKKKDYLSIAAVSAAIVGVVIALILCVKHLKKKQK